MLFLLFSLVVGLLALNLYRPLARGNHAAVLAFAFGMLVGELTPFFFIVEAVIVYFAWGDSIQGAVGFAGIALLLSANLAIAYHYLAGFRVAALVHEKLQRALGDNYHASIPQELKAPGFEVLPWHTGLRPFATRNPAVKLVADVEYGNGDGVSLVLDIYHHRKQDPAGSAPVLFQIHGGAWLDRAGSKRLEAQPLIQQMAAQGWVVVSIEYRASPAFAFPTHIIDCKRALVWVKRHIAEYGGNPDFIVATGGSAGGHLSGLLALTPNEPEYQPGFEMEDTSVQGCMPLYGILDFANDLELKVQNALANFLAERIVQKPPAEAKAILERGSPLRRVHENAPPFLTLHGSSDSLTSVDIAGGFAKGLAAVSKQPVVCVEIPWAQHGFDMMNTPRTRGAVNGMNNFLSYLYGLYLQGTMVPARVKEAS